MFKRIATVCFAGLISSTLSAHAAPITSELNCPIVSGAACTSTTGSYGTITFTDVSGGVDISLALTSGTTVQDILFNYTTGNTVVSFSPTINSTPVNSTNTPNGISLNGSGNYNGNFDAIVGGPSNGSLTGFGSNFTVLLGNTTLTAATIAGQLDTNGLLDFAVHLQNCGPSTGVCQPGLVGGNSLAVGEVPGGTTPPIPEPTSISLLGTGMAGLAAMLRRRIRIPTA